MKKVFTEYYVSMNLILYLSNSILCDCVDKYVIELCESLSEGMRQYLANKTNKAISEITRNDIANELFDIILAEIDWNLKYKLPEDVDWEFYVTPVNGDEQQDLANKNKE